MANMFEYASRNKLRFESPQGLLSTEDLWELPLSSHSKKANLDEIAVGLHEELNRVVTRSFVQIEKNIDPTIQMKFDIVKYIIDFKMAENKAKLEAKDKAEKKQNLLAVLADKQQENLRNMSIEEIQQLIAAI